MEETKNKRGRKAIATGTKRVRTVLYLHPDHVRPAKELKAIIEGGNLPAREIDSYSELKVQLNEKERELSELKVQLNSTQKELKVQLNSKHGFSAVQEREPELRAQMDVAYGPPEPLKELFETIAKYYSMDSTGKERYIMLMMQQAKAQWGNSKWYTQHKRQKARKFSGLLYS